MSQATDLMRAIDTCCGKRGPYCEACQARLAELKTLATKPKPPTVPYVDVCHETAYGQTTRLPFMIRVF